MGNIMIDIKDKINKLEEHIIDIEDDPNMLDMVNSLKAELLTLYMQYTDGEEYDTTI